MFNVSERIPLENVTIWYRCHLCHGYLFSIPELRKHAATVHNCHSIELPKNLPPGAEDGKVYYTYDTPYNKPPLPYRRHKLWGNERITQNSASTCSMGYDDDVPNHSLSEANYEIRVRQLVDLQDDLTDDDNRNQMVQENRLNNLSPARMPVASPSDSGIQMHDGGSEFQEDDGQQSNQSAQTSNDGPIPSTSKVALPPNNAEKLKCHQCGKRFNNASSLNFHKKKFHSKSDEKTQKPGDIDTAPATPPEKVILTIQRDSATGNLRTLNGENKRKLVEDNSLPTTEHPPRMEIQAEIVQRPASSDNSSSNVTKKAKLTEKNLEDEEGAQTPSVSPSPVKNNSGSKRLTRASKGLRPFIVPDDFSDSDTQLETSSTATKTRRRRQSKIIMSSDSEEEQNSKKVTSPVAPTRRSVRRRVKNSPESDLSEPPIVRTTRARTRAIKKKSPTPSPSNSSESDMATHTDASDSDDSNDSTEGELSDRSTTPEKSASSASQSEGEDNSHNTKKSSKKAAESNSSSSDSDDLFTPIKVKQKKASNHDAKEGRSSGKNSKKTSTVDNGKTSESHEDSEKNTSVSDDTKSLSSSVSKVITCQFCDKSFKGDKAYTKHISEKHEDKNFLICCGYCPTKTKFTSADAWNAHLKTHAPV